MFSKLKKNVKEEKKKKHKPKDKTLMKDDINPYLIHKMSRVKEEKKMLNPEDKTLRKDNLNLIYLLMNEMKMRHNPVDEPLAFVGRKDDPDPVSSVKEEKKMYDPRDKTMTFVDRSDDLDPVSSDDGSLKALMSCGHAVTPETLTGWCRNMLDEGDYNFRCPALVNGTKKCNKLWTYQELRRLADLSPEEMQYFEETIARLAVTSYCETQPCPQCKTCVERTDPSNLCVTCTICAANGATCFLFCWQCLQLWKGTAPQRYRCSNSGCVNKDLQILKTCRTISLPEVSGATNCPSVRACPTCGLKVEHNQQFCKNIDCPRCHVEFCFICVKLKLECFQTSSAYEMCVTGVAPRQTSIPIWQKR